MSLFAWIHGSFIKTVFVWIAPVVFFAGGNGLCPPKFLDKWEAISSSMRGYVWISKQVNICYLVHFQWVGFTIKTFFLYWESYFNKIWVGGGKNLYSVYSVYNIIYAIWLNMIYITKQNVSDETIKH